MASPLVRCWSWLREECADAWDLRAWLKTYGIGVDCGGFVMHALARLLHDAHTAVGEEPDRDPRAIVGFVRPGWVYREVVGGPAGDPGAAVRFRAVPTPGEAMPGDVLVSGGHIRIVLRTARAPDGSIVMQQGESISARGVPRGLSEPETDIGPRPIVVRYPAADRGSLPRARAPDCGANAPPRHR